MGLFCTVAPGSLKDWEIDTLKTANPVETGRNDGAVSVLFAHIISTRTDSELVTDKAMDYPRDFRTVKPNTSGLGHLEVGRTVAIHSLAVHPKLQGCGLGKLIMKSYMQQINNSGTADRISLISQGVCVPRWR
jgi:ribosomal protein S18 acetylase RimI-like enzyme